MRRTLRHGGTAEESFQSDVWRLARLNGWRVYHTRDSRRSPAGFPDLVLVRDGRLIFAELKSERGRVEPEQRAWLGDLMLVPGAEVRIWRPSDLEEIVQTLARPRAGRRTG